MTSRTVAGNISYPLKLAGTPKIEIERRTAELLKFVGLSEKAKDYPEQLSGGQKQRQRRIVFERASSGTFGTFQVLAGHSF